MKRLSVTLTVAQAGEVLSACNGRLTELWEQDGGGGTEDDPFRGHDRILAEYRRALA